MATKIPTTSGDRHSKNLLALLAAGFILTGIPTVIIGPILPVFISRRSLSDTQAGLFFSVQFTAALCGVWITTALTSRHGYRPSLVIGYLLTGVGLNSVFAYFGVVAVIGAAAAAGFTVETKNRSLELASAVKVYRATARP